MSQTRRQFVKRSAAVAGFGAMAGWAPTTVADSETTSNQSPKLPREVWVASFCSRDLQVDTYQESAFRLVR